MNDEVKIPEFRNEFDISTNETENQMTGIDNESEQIGPADNSFDLLNAAKAVGRTLGTTGKKVVARVNKEIQDYRAEQERIRLEKERILKEQQEEQERQRKIEEEKRAELRRLQEEQRIKEEKRKAEERERLRLEREKREREELKKKAVLTAYGASDLSEGFVRDYLYSLLEEFSDDSFQASVISEQFDVSKEGTEIDGNEEFNGKVLELIEEHLKYARTIFKQNNLIITMLDSIEKNTSQKTHDEMLLKAIQDLQHSIDNIDLTPEVSFDDERILESNRQLIEAIKNIDTGGYDDSDVLYELERISSRLDSDNSDY